MNSLREYKVVLAEAELKPSVLALLQENDLPITDIDENKVLFACLNNEDVIGTGGLSLLGIVHCFGVSV